MFDGTLGDWKTSPAHFELKEGARPHHGRAYPIPQAHKEVFKREVDRLVGLGVLKHEPDSRWGSATFIIPKKQGTVRFLTDFREVNKRILRKPYPLPKISTVLQELEGFQWATSLDLNMGYYHIRLDPDSSEICTIPGASLGKVLLPETSYGDQRIARHFSGKDVFSDAIIGIC